MKILYALELPLKELREIGKDKNLIQNNCNHFLFPLIAFVHSQGNEICIVSASREIRENEVYVNEGFRVVIVGLWKHGRVSALDSFRNDIKRIEKVVRSEMADVYHAHWCYEYAMACLNVSKEKTVITLHDWPDIVCNAIGNFFWKKKGMLGNKVLKVGRHFTAVSPCIAERFFKLNSTASICVIPNYLTVDEYQLFSKGENKADDIFHIIAVNNGFNKIKNTQVTLDVFSKFHEKNFKTELTMCGFDYEAEGKAYKWAKDKEITDAVNFVGGVGRKELATLFRRADVLLHTSVEESFGLVYLEAMASRTVIIAGIESGATPWVVRNKEDGLLVDVYNEEEIYNALERVYYGQIDTGKMLENASSRLLENFLFDSCAAKYMEYYCRITDNEGKM